MTPALWIIGATVVIAFVAALAKLFLLAVDDYTSRWEDGV